MPLTFITVHDTDIIFDLERRCQFDILQPYVYLYVGKKPMGELPPDVHYVAPYLSHENIEHWPQFYDFTGWWWLWRNEFITDDKVIFLQYDMRVVDLNIKRNVEMALDDHVMIAFTAGHYDAGNFLLHLPGFEETYQRGLSVVGANMDAWPRFNEWPCTQGTAWRTKDFYDYMAWIAPLFPVWADDVWAGHLMERTPKAWLAETGAPYTYMVGAIAHEARDCHGTGALMRGDRALFEQRDATFRTYTR